MLFFKRKKSFLQQKNNYIKEVYYKLYKLLVIFLKWNNFLACLLLQKKHAIFYHNICIFSNKAKSISRKLKISRIIMRNISNKGIFFGLSKLSW
jgi:ribosomal protein S14